MTCTDHESFIRLGSKFDKVFLVDEGKEGPNTTLLVGHQLPASKTPFKLTLNVGLVAL